MGKSAPLISSPAPIRHSLRLLFEKHTDPAIPHPQAKKGMARSQSVRPEVQGPKIELAAQEPPAITLDADDLATDGSTEVPFIIKVSPRDGEKLRRETFPDYAEIKSQLVTKTHMTPDGIKGISSMIALDYIKVDGKTTTKVQYSHKQSHKIPITRWERSVSGKD